MQSFEVEHTPCHLIVDNDALNATVTALADEPVLAVDTEFLRTNTFFPIVGLIQIATHQVCYLIDPVACTTLEPLKAVLLDEAKRIVMHSCSEDLEVFLRVFGQVPPQVFDTQIAASLVSRDHQLGLQKLIRSYCGKDIPKDETRSDWTKRPLSESQLTYAALDVVCLLQVYDALLARLDALGRTAWCVEECQRLVDAYGVESDNARYYRSIGDAWKLKGKKLQVLQALAEWRETVARERDKPRGFIFSDKELFAIADKLPGSTAQLAEAGNFKPVQVRKYGSEALGIIDTVIKSNAEPLPLLEKPFNNTVKKLTRCIKPEVEKKAIALDMATDRLASRKYLEKYVKAVIEGKDLPGYFQGWRAQALVPELDAALEQIQSNQPG